MKNNLDVILPLAWVWRESTWIAKWVLWENLTFSFPLVRYSGATWKWCDFSFTLIHNSMEIWKLLVEIFNISLVQWKTIFYSHSFRFPSLDPAKRLKGRLIHLKLLKAGPVIRPLLDFANWPTIVWGKNYFWLQRQRPSSIDLSNMQKNFTCYTKQKRMFVSNNSYLISSIMLGLYYENCSVPFSLPYFHMNYLYYKFYCVGLYYENLFYLILFPLFSQ